MALDPRTHAVRDDLADLRLADRVFAPHYAAAKPCRVDAETPLRAARAADSEVVATLAAGEAFDLLDLVGEDAWGTATDRRLVGYCDRHRLSYR